MNRSEINDAIEYVIEKLKYFKIPLPEFAYYTIDDWKNIGYDEREIYDNMLGWDVTDFGKEDFLKYGLTVFVFRNGNFNNKSVYNKSYCEKLLYVREGQILPFHFHWNKMEDIINRGGGNVEITLYQSDKYEKFADEDVIVSIDGKKTIINAGGKVLLKPGQSITLLPYQYHKWEGVIGTGDTVLFEVSTTNDDNKDNRFYENQKRIPNIYENEKPKYLIFSDYKNYINQK